MKTIKLKTLILESVRACMYCDLLRPADNVGDRSHGYCREHFIAFLMSQFKMSHQKARDYVKEKEQVKEMDYSPNTSGAKETDPLPVAPQKDFSGAFKAGQAQRVS